MAQPFLSVIIPAYNEAQRIPKSFEALRRYAGSKDFSIELIIVDDGSKDSTPAILENMRVSWPGLRILRHEITRGKGYSVRRGFLDAQGEYILFTDADLSTPIEEADQLLSLIESEHADAVIGSRALRRDLIGIHQHWLREFGGRFFNLLMRLFTGLKIYDTQCGFKLFRRETTRFAFELQRVEGFGFDPEVLFLIQRFGGKILEVPVRWDNDPATTVRFARDSSIMLMELALLRWRVWTGKYGSVSGRKAI